MCQRKMLLSSYPIKWQLTYMQYNDNRFQSRHEYNIPRDSLHILDMLGHAMHRHLARCPYLLLRRNILSEPPKLWYYVTEKIITKNRMWNVKIQNRHLNRNVKIGKSLKIPKGKSEAADQRTDNIITKWKKGLHCFRCRN